MFLVLLFLFNQVIPSDLKEVSLFWRKVDERTLINIAKTFGRDIYVASTIAVFVIEQPSRDPKYLLNVPNNNSIGMHPWKKRYPWGWSNYWRISNVYPNGYFLAKEVATQKKKPYFSFEYLAHCFRLMHKIVIYRSIINGKVYNQRWVGKSGYNRRFDEIRDKYLSLLSLTNNK